MDSKIYRIIFFTLVSFVLLNSVSIGGGRKFIKIHEFTAPEARQGIAVDANYIYVVGTQEIGKYDKQTFKLVAKWKGKEDGTIIHLDSGVIVDGLLYCSHSNYPGVPMTSSVEIWDAETLEHVGSHSFGIMWGSCTWIDQHDGFWWAGFAHYGKWKAEAGTDEKWTTVVKFDDQWRKIEAWVFPKEVSDKFIPMSNSGGSWGPDGLLYCTGHDGAEVYAMKLPEAGSILELVETVPIELYGQGIAWDRTQPNMIYGIIKKGRRVIVSEFVTD
ncbi:hypothetical protein ACFLTH_15965 [Bacteroidota bacterium]